jgi:uncharacterized protein DUF5678
MTTTQFDWFTQADLGFYKGRYVIIRGRRIVASGKSPHRLLQKFRSKHPKEIPLLAKIPDDETLILVGS